jgi:NADH dehydrogenase FAD-containing subunit
LTLNTNTAFKITLIDRKEFYEWVTAVPKSIVSRSGYFDDQATIDYNEMVNVNKVLGANVTYVQADLTELVDENTIKIKRISKGKASKEEELSFDFLALCTGAIYSINGTAEDIAKIYTKKERSTLLEKYREQIEEASSILVVGGGPTGLETVGELLIRFGETKQIGIANSAAHLLSGFPENASTAAEEYLEGRGVKLHLNSKYDPKGDLAKKYDYAIK